MQSIIDNSGHSDILVDQERQTILDLDHALSFKEAFWKEKSRIEWALEGDRNTTYFHKLAKINHSTKSIVSLRVDDSILTNQSDIASHVMNHFTSLFNSTSFLQDNDLIHEVISPVITKNINHLLTIMPSAEEIQKATFALNPSSSPGPDGFGGVFFQTYWDIIKEDMVRLC